MSPLISIFKCIPFPQPGFIPPSAGQFQMGPDRQFQLTLPMRKQDGLDLSVSSVHLPLWRLAPAALSNSKIPSMHHLHL
jgi:hypothetical protein